MLERTHPRRRDHGGAAAVEFALVVVPLLYLVFGIISYGYMLSFRQALSQAAAEGARAAAVTPGGIANATLVTRAKNAINDSLGSYGVTCDLTSGAADSLKHGTVGAGSCLITAPQPCTGAIGDTCVKVTLDYTYRDDALIPTIGFGVVLPGHLTYTSEVRVS